MGVGWWRREKKMVNRPRGTLGTKTRREKGTLARALWGYRVRPPLCLIVVREEKEGKPVHSIRVANAKRPLLQGRLRVRSPFGMRTYSSICIYIYIYIGKKKEGRKKKFFGLFFVSSICPFFIFFSYYVNYYCYDYDIV